MSLTFGELTFDTIGSSLTGKDAARWYNNIPSPLPSNNTWFGKLGDTIGGGLSMLSDSMEKNPNAWNLGMKALEVGGNWYQANKMADISKQMNDFYQKQYTREWDRQEQSEKNFNLGFGYGNKRTV